MALTPSTMLDLGTRAPDFSLVNAVDGQTVALGDLSDTRALVVMFISNHCPYVIHYKEALATFGREVIARGVAVVAIASNDYDNPKYADDRPERMKADAETYGYTFPYLVDPDQSVAKAYAAACTPDFYLFDGDQRLAYRGRFDASRPGNTDAITGDDLRAAVDAVLAGSEPSRDQVPSMGCNIKWKPGNEPPYFG
ncbi:MAG: thioredoxin family protein [Myxococcota bacterium]|nr:thioredoxin family protein [Myxococcota bacterium]